MQGDNALRLSVVLGAVVLTERQARGLTQQELAQRAGLHAMALSKLERGVQQDVGVETVRRIAQALSVTGSVTSASALLATAEQWQEQLRQQFALEQQIPTQQADKGPSLSTVLLAGAVTGAAIAAVILLLQKGKAVSA